jgi:hypothetical protein
MEWAILFTVVVGATARYGILAVQWMEKREPQGPFRRPTGQILGRLPGEVSMNDMNPAQLERFVQNLQSRSRHRKRRWVEEKVNWKVEGF